VTLVQLADDVAHFGDEVARRALPRIGAEGQKAARAMFSGPVMGDEMTATVDIAADAVTVSPSPRGPWVLMELGSAKAAWRIPRRRRGGKRLRINGSVRVHVIHPRIRPQKRWTKAKVNMRTAATKVWRDTTADVWKGVGS
jgi:hypothetical protein